MEQQTEEIKKVDLRKARFSNAPWFDRIQISNVIIGGAGNIGSWVSLFLARQGCSIYVYDFDFVDESNIAAQLYPVSGIGNLKTEVLSETLSNLVNSDIEFSGKFTALERFEKGSMIDKYCFSCFDNMEARKALFESWVDLYSTSEDAIFIDGRLLAEIGQVFFVTKDRIEQYRATLFSDAEVALEDCAYKGTTHCSAIIAGLMVSGFNNFLTNLDNKVRDLPFNIDYQLPLFNFDIKS